MKSALTILILAILMSEPLFGQIPNDSVKSSQGLLQISGKDLDFHINGRLHRVATVVNDGKSSNLYFMDSEQGPTYLQFGASQSSGNNFTMSAIFELGIQSNRPVSVHQENPNPGTALILRKAELVFDWKQMAKVSFGRGLASGWVSPQVDLSTTSAASLSPVGILVPGMRFVDKATGELSDINVGSYFINLEQLLFADRLRVDIQPFGKDFTLSGTLAADMRYDITSLYNKDLNAWQVRTALSYQNKAYTELKHMGLAFFSSLHKQSGLNLTTSVGIGQAYDSRSPYAYNVKLGWNYNLKQVGSAGVSADISKGFNPTRQGEKMESIGFFALQKINAFNLSIYCGYRSYTLKTNEIKLYPIHTFTFGLIYSF